MNVDKSTLEKIKILIKKTRKFSELFELGIQSLSNISYLFFPDKAKFDLEMVETLLRTQKELIEHLEAENLEDSKILADSAIEYTPILQISLIINSNLIKQLNGAFIKLPYINIERALNEISNITIEVNEFNKCGNSTTDYLLGTTSTETTDLGYIKLRTIQQTQLQVESLKDDVTQLKNYITEDSKKKNEMHQELLEYFQHGGSDIVKVKKVAYNSKKAELIIDDKKINLRADSNQHYLCKVLFANKISVKKVWEVYDIVDAMGESSSYSKKWINSVYNTIRHLNDKIQLKTGLERFILYDNKTIIVNPKYLDLT